MEIRNRVALVSLIAYDQLYQDLIREKKGVPDYFDREILGKHPDPAQKWCKMIGDRGINVEFWYPSLFSKGTAEFNHQYGHKLIRVSGFRLGRFLTKYFDCLVSFRLLRELKHRKITHVLLLKYLMNRRLIIDMADILILSCLRNSIKVFPIFGGGSLNDYGFLKRKVKMFFLKKTNGFLCQSKFELNLMVKKFKYPEKKILHFLNPLDLENFPQISRLKCAEILKMDKRKKYILFVGRLVRSKGIHHLINILPRLKHDIQDIELILIGDGPYKHQLRELSRELKVENSVKILDYIDNQKLKYFYNLCEALVLPSYSEGTPNVFMEAISCNTVCIGTDVGGIPDLLGNDVGILVPVQDEEILFQEIKKVIREGFDINQTQRQKLLKQFNMETKGQELSEFLFNMKQ